MRDKKFRVSLPHYRTRRPKRAGAPPQKMYLMLVEYRWEKSHNDFRGRLIRGRWVPCVKFQTNSGFDFIKKSYRVFLSQLGLKKKG